MGCRRLLLALCLLAAAGAVTPATAGSVPIESGGTSFTVPVTSYKEIRFRRVVRQEYDFSCGSAALATLLTYHNNRPTLERAVLKAMMEHGDKEKIRKDGFSLLDMKRYLVSIGLDSEGYRVSLDKVADVGIPGITLIETNGYSHFVVLKGIRGQEVLVGDPALGTRVMSRKQFSAVWNGIFFIIAGPLREERLQFNRSDDWRQHVRAPLGWALSNQSLADLTLTLPAAGSF